MKKIRTGIIGATGYTGSELVRILSLHPEIEIHTITSESHKGKQFAEIHPYLRDVNITLSSVDKLQPEKLDVVFLALPHGVSMEFVKQLSQTGLKIIDLSGDFRLSSPEVYESWYNIKHIYSEGFNHAIYGMPELYRKEIRNAKLVANPGCFPTGAILGVAPLIKNGLIKPDRIIIDSKTGATGAGVKASSTTHFSNVNENFKAYGLKNHRHTIEIEEKLDLVSNTDKNVKIQFTPHLLPVDRGILTTIYTQPVENLTDDDLVSAFNCYYKDEPFIKILNSVPEIKHVRGSNFCHIFTTFDSRTNNIITVTGIDNLVKGAAGQAVHNMNIMFNIDESLGLKHISLNP